MHELVNLQIGGCGIRIGNKFWEAISSEHGLDVTGNGSAASEQQRERINVYYANLTTTGYYRPRTLLVDLDPATNDMTRASPVGRMISSNCMLFGNVGANNNFAIGNMTLGPQFRDDVMDRVRWEMEHCDAPQGFQMTHSLGGGTGSGLGTLVLSYIRDEFPDLILNTFSVLPSSKLSGVVVEPYNAILALNKLIELSDETICFDNEALFGICRGLLKISSPHHEDLNHLVCSTMSGITTCLRLPSDGNTDLRKLATKMVPNPRHHFLVPGFAPLTSRTSLQYQALSVPELTQQMFDPKTMMDACDPSGGRCLSAAAIFRGPMSLKEVDDQILSIKKTNSSWIPDNVKTAVCDVPQSGLLKTSATLVGNTTAIHDVFKLLLDEFDAMYRHKSFLHWYKNEGMDDMDFVGAAANVTNLLSEYKQHESTGAGVYRIMNKCLRIIA